MQPITQADIDLHNQITFKLPQADINALVNCDYNGLLKGDLLDSLDAFPKSGGGIFDDETLEKAKSDLLAAIHSYLREVSNNNVPNETIDDIKCASPVKASEKAQDLAAAYQAFVALKP